jgi:hypothetical protein
MAWLSMLAGLLFPLLIFASDSNTLSQIAIPFYAFVTGVVMTYITAATYDDTHGKQ